MQARSRIASLLGKDCTEDPREGEGEAAGSRGTMSSFTVPQYSITSATAGLSRASTSMATRTEKATWSHNTRSWLDFAVITVHRAGIRFYFFFFLMIDILMNLRCTPDGRAESPILSSVMVQNPRIQPDRMILLNCESYSTHGTSKILG